MSQVDAVITGEPQVRFIHADICCKTSPPTRTSPCSKRGQRGGTAVARALVLVHQEHYVKRILIQQRQRLLNLCLSLRVRPVAGKLLNI